MKMEMKLDEMEFYRLMVKMVTIKTKQVGAE